MRITIVVLAAALATVLSTGCSNDPAPSDPVSMCLEQHIFQNCSEIVHDGASGIPYPEYAAPGEATQVPTLPKPMELPDWCTLVAPHLTAAQKQIDTFVDHPEGARTNQQKLTKVIGSLRHDEEIAPELYKTDVAAVRKPLEEWLTSLNTRQDTTIDLGNYRASSDRISVDCG